MTGTETRAFCYVDDIVGGILAMCPEFSCDLMAAPAAARSRQHMDYWL